MGGDRLDPIVADDVERAGLDESAIDARTTDARTIDVGDDVETRLLANQRRQSRMFARGEAGWVLADQVPDGVGDVMTDEPLE